MEEADAILAQAHEDATAQRSAAAEQAHLLKERLEEQFAWRKEQLTRDVNALLARKSAIVAQMSAMQQLVDQATTDYPDSDPFENSDMDHSDFQWLISQPDLEQINQEESTRILNAEQLHDIRSQAEHKDRDSLDLYSESESDHDSSAEESSH